MDQNKPFPDYFKDIPTILFRNDSRIKQLTGKTSRTWANLDAKGIGPKRRIKIGGAVAYPREELIEFLLSQVKIAP
jgi:hypothetical protein